MSGRLKQRCSGSLAFMMICIFMFAVTGLPRHLALADPFIVSQTMMGEDFDLSTPADSGSNGSFDNKPKAVDPLEEIEFDTPQTEAGKDSQFIIFEPVPLGEEKRQNNRGKRVTTWSKQPVKEYRETEPSEAAAEHKVNQRGSEPARLTIGVPQEYHEEDPKEATQEAVTEFVDQIPRGRRPAVYGSTGSAERRRKIEDFFNNTSTQEAHEPYHVDSYQEHEESPEGASAEAQEIPAEADNEDHIVETVRFGDENYRYPYQLLHPYWQQVRKALKQDSLSDLQAALNKLYEKKLDTGYHNTPQYASLLLRQAYMCQEKHDYEKARLLGEAAYNIAPDFFPASQFLIQLGKIDKKKNSAKVSHWNGNFWKSCFFYFPRQYRTIGRCFIVFILSAYVLFLIFGAYLFGRYWKLLFHYVKERFTIGPYPHLLSGLFFVLALLAIILLSSPFWMATALGFLFGEFSHRWEKRWFLVFLLLWASAPLLIKGAVSFIAPLPDSAASIYQFTQGDWDAASEQALDKALNKRPEDYNLLLTKALAQKRRGDYTGAIETLEKALEIYPERGELYNNLATVYAIQGDTSKATDMYNQAIAIGPGQAAPHYNLSQLMRKRFLFIKGGKEFNIARGIDPKKTDYQVYIQSPHPNRFYMDIEPPLFSLWRYSFDLDNGHKKAAEDLWAFLVGGPPLGWSPWIFMALAVTYAFFSFFQKREPDVFRCNNCGLILCSKCHSGTEVEGVCSPCYQALYEKENIERDSRHKQFRRMSIYHAQRMKTIKVLNLIFPGLGYSFVEERSKGLILLFIFVFALLCILLRKVFLPSSMIIWTDVSRLPFFIGAGLTIALYLFIQKGFNKKISSRR